MHGIKEGTVVF